MKSKFQLNELLNHPISAAEKFNQRIKIKKNIKMPDVKKWPESWKTVYFKGYSRLKEIKLPGPDLSSKISLKKTLQERKSSRQFSDSPMSLTKISTLLYFGAGLKDKNKPLQTKRFYPSGGGRYPLEIYLMALNVQGLSKGVYHYYLKSHSLEELFLIKRFSLKEYIIHPWFKSASCFIIISAIFKRTTIKYSDRGYRLVLEEAGHMGQNIYLLSSALNLACCGIDGFIDDQLNRLLDIDGINESVIYILALGKHEK